MGILRTVMANLAMSVDLVFSQPLLELGNIILKISNLILQLHNLLLKLGNLDKFLTQQKWQISHLEIPFVHIQPSSQCHVQSLLVNVALLVVHHSLSAVLLGPQWQH